MMEVPQLHGFGPAANRLLEAYKMLLKVFECFLNIGSDGISHTLSLLLAALNSAIGSSKSYTK